MPNGKKSKSSKQKQQLHEMLFMLPITDNAQDQMKAQDTRERNTFDRCWVGSRPSWSLLLAPAIAIKHTSDEYNLFPTAPAWPGLLLIIPRCVIIDFPLTLRGRQSAKREKKIGKKGKAGKKVKSSEAMPTHAVGPHFELRPGPRQEPSRSGKNLHLHLARHLCDN